MKIGKRTTLAIAELVEDTSIYPRHEVDGSNTQSLMEALKAGANLPPIVIDAKTKRIVDGWHRARAYRRILGETGTVDVELRSYADEADLLADSIRLNSAHGRRLDRVDQVRCVSMLQDRGVSKAVIAAVLNVPEERVERLQVRVAIAPASGCGAAPGTTQVALKRPAAHLAGRQLTEAQAQAHISAPGTSYLLVCRQIRQALTADLINPEDERLEGELRELRGALEKWFAARVP